MPLTSVIMILLPMFPLQIVVFPKESLNLHIFEPRYRELIHDCENEGIMFGIPYHQPDQWLKFGSIVKLDMISKTYPDGKMDIKTTGIKPFEIKRFVKTYPKKNYPGAYIEELYWEEEGDASVRYEIRNLLEELYQHMKIPKRPAAMAGEFITFEIAHKVGFSREQEYAFLQIMSEIERQDYMLQHLKRMVPMVKEAEDMRKKVQLNGHFKSIDPPQL